MRSHVPRAGPAEALAVRISHFIVWISGTGVSGAPCPIPSHGLFGSGKTEPGIGKGQAGRSQDLQVAQGGQSPKGAATVPLPKAGKSSAARIPIPAPPAAGQLSQLLSPLLQHATLSLSCLLAWWLTPSRCWALSPSGSRAASPRASHPSGHRASPWQRPTAPSPSRAWCRWVLQLCRGCSAPCCVLGPSPADWILPTGHGGRAGRGAAHGAAGDHCHRQGFW